LFAVGSGYIYTLQRTPTPVLNIAVSGQNLLLSWLFPSMNFVLQESPELASWSDVSATPSLNYSNLQNQVTVSQPNGNRFYRLIARGATNFKAAEGLTADDSGVLQTLRPGDHATVFRTGFIFDDGQQNALERPGSSIKLGLSAEEAGILAQELANKRAQSLFNCQPFDNGSRARLVEGQWVWRERRARGRFDFEAKVQFREDGAEPDVDVRLLDIGL
jgi:hypothetical protein